MGNSYQAVLQDKLARFLLVVLPLACLLPLQAAAMPPALCDQQDTGERFKCKFQNIIDQQNVSADKLASMGTIPKERTDKLKRQVGKTMNTNSKADRDTYMQFTKKKEPQCDIVELENHPQANGNGDGICDTRGPQPEVCAEDNSDQIGNNDGVCSPTKGKKREACLQICDEEALRGNPNNFDDSPGSRGADFEVILDDMTDDYIELNDNLDEQLSLQASMSSLSASGIDPCDPILTARPSQKQQDNSFMAAYIAENAAEQADNVCGLDGAGFNIHLACIITDGIYLVAKGIADTITSANEAVDSETVDAIMECVKSIQASSDDQQAQLDSMDRKLDTTLQQLDATLQKLDETVQLLNTPLGRREDFPR